MVWVSIIVFSTGGSATPFFVYYFFPIITASSRYGMTGGLSAAVAGALTYGFIRFYFDWEDSLGIDIDRFVVRSVYLFVLAYIFGFLTEFESKQNQKLLALSKTAGEVATLEERRRITQELHDGLLQSLATLILRLEACRRQFLESPAELERELLGYSGVKQSSVLAELEEMLFVPLRLRLPNGTVLSPFSTVATFGTALDITLEELSIEAFFPADEATKDYLRGN
jgi:hypothetical protein